VSKPIDSLECCCANGCRAIDRDINQFEAGRQMSHAPPPDLSDHVEETIRSMARLSNEHQESASLQQRAVAHITGFLSQPAVVGILGVMIGCWAAANVLGPSVGWRALDPPPFQWLQGMMTLVSLFMVFLLLGAQKHEDRLNKNRELLTLELAILSEQKIAKVIQLLEEFRRDSPHIHDRVDAEADQLAMPARPQSVLDAIKETKTNETG
jgi:uncharacterized membrane protein